MKNDHFERRLLTVIEANTSDLTTRQQDRIIGAVRQELSLLDSQAAGTSESLRAAVLGVQNKMGCWCVTPMVNISEGRDHEPRCQAVLTALREPDAATRMRDLCVERVTKLRDEWANSTDPLDRSKYDAARAVITELSYVTLDNGEQEQNG